MFDNEEFFESNTVNINRIISEILIFINFLAPLFFILNKAKIFQISNQFTFIFAILIFIFTFIDVILVFVFGSKKFKSKYPSHFDLIQHITKYFGLFGASIILGILGTHTHIGIYISYAIMVFMSCLYYCRKTTSIMAFSCYIIMLISIYVKSIGRINEGMSPNTVIGDFISYSAGFTIEYFFVFLISFSISKISARTLNQAIDTNEQLKKTQLEIMDFIPKILESHEVFTGHHVKHTVKYVDLISRELKRSGLYLDQLTDDNINLFAAAANLHDIGKVHIPDNILNKPGKYTPEEFEMMKSHPAEGRKLIESLPCIKDGKFNKIAIDMAYCHHEKYDGSGYPNGIVGDKIPLCARIMAAADVLDALLSWRPYKESIDIDTALKIIKDSSGSHFEPCIATALINLKPLIFSLSEDFKSKEIEDEEKEYTWRQKLNEERKLNSVH